MAASSSSASPPPPPPDGDPLNPTPLSVKKPPPGPWSYHESVHLIDAYQERWYSLGRGQLRARHWEEVAESLAARCGLPRPVKTAIQCRHKIEKLRKRYRVESLKESADAVAARWPLFSRMDLLERGPSSILRAIGPPPSSSPSPSTSPSPPPSRFRKPSFASAAGGSDGKRKRTASPAGSGPEEQEGLVELASAVRSIGEGLMRVENMKLEMMREMEKTRMEIEMKRTEMILESQRETAEAIAKAYCSSKKKYKRMSSPDS